ncbi:MAG: Verru_Chthon cassette protein A [Verrucomicrobia bacterium]|nr:Verru_Chthon cassette protein A [Verrucomicrobiota bacterium]
MKKISDFRFPISDWLSCGVRRAKLAILGREHHPGEFPAIANRKSQTGNPERGAALVVTLAILVLVTVLVLSLFLSVTSERTESAAAANQGDAQRLAAGVVDLVKSTITQATTGFESDAAGVPNTASPVAWASQPGLIRTWNTSGNPYRSYRLYSSGNITVTAQGDLVTDTTELANWKSGAPANAGSYNALWCDLNAPAANPANALTYPIVNPPADTNSGSTATDATNGVPTDNPATASQEGVQGFAITSPPGFTAGNASATNNPAPMPVKWLYVLQDGSYVSPAGTGSVVTVPGGNQTNPIIGRAAYWTDDDTSKVNINTASEGVYWDKPYAYNREEAGLAGSSPVLGYALSIPAQDEFQRIAGHPAFTSLSAVLGGWMPRPDIGFSNSGSLGATAYTGGTFSNNLLPYYNLTPRAGDGGTKGGTRAVLDLTTAGNAVTLGTAHLYTGAEELLYDADRNENNANLTPDRIRKTNFFLTANSKAPETTLLEQPRVSLWPIQQGVGARNAKDKLLAFASTINAYPFYFQRATEWQSDDSPGSSQSATADASIPRNDALLKYLLHSAQQTVPGFGASLSNKYQNGKLPQILVGMFDTIRSLVNTTSRSLAPAYTFAPYGVGSPFNAVSLGSVVPARATLDGTEVKGFGRFPAVKEVVVVFMASEWKDETTLGAAAPWTPTPNADGLPDDVAADNGTFNGVGDPQTTAIRAFVFLVTENLAPGQPDAQAAVRYQIEGLEALQVNGKNLGFPSASNAVLISRGVSSSTTLTAVSPTYSQFSSAGLYENYTAAAIARKSGVSDGVTSSTGRKDPKAMIFPFIGSSIPLPDAGGNSTTAQPSRFGLDASGNYQDLRPSVVPTTMVFSGGTLKIRLYPGTGNTFAANDYLQEMEVILPSTTLPVPQITRSGFSASPGADGGTVDFDASAAETDRTKATFYSGLKGGIADSRNFDQRLSAQIIYNLSWGNPQYAGATSPQSIIRRGDVMRSVYLDPSGPARGDLRLAAGLRHVPDSFFTKFPEYDNLNKLQATSSMAYQSTTLDTNPQMWMRQLNRDRADYQGKLVNQPYASGFLPYAPKGMTAANLGSSVNPGDWNTGVGGNYDGAYINMGDQGFVLSTADIYQNVYYPSNLVSAAGAASLASFSPNRQIASPVLFGSLPSGITPLSSASASGTQSPWQTLLFSPNPSAKNNHPGLSAGGNGTGPDARPPYTTAPDHLFLDKFWMPVVEPYAISEPFSTAGKVNLNFQIAPFSHIERSTGLHAVLKAMKMPAIPDALAANYRKSQGWTDMMNTEPGTPSWRYNIDVAAVVAGMKNRRFDNNDIFRSASEVSNIFMVPLKQPNATAATPAGPSGTALQRYNATANWWDDKTLTGDNLRESPYNYIYPRITTKSNTYTVHLRVQALKQVPGWRTSAADWGRWDETRDQVVSEYRGSASIERYVDPNDTSIADFALPANYSKNLAPYYRWRTVTEKQFVP